MADDGRKSPLSTPSRTGGFGLFPFFASRRKSQTPPVVPLGREYPQQMEDYELIEECGCGGTSQVRSALRL